MAWKAFPVYGTTLEFGGLVLPVHRVGLSVKTSKLEKTHSHSQDWYKEFFVGLSDAGEVSVDVPFSTSLLKALRTEDELNLVFSDPDSTGWKCDAFCKSYSWKLGVDEAGSATLVFRLTGEPTYTGGAATYAAVTVPEITLAGSTISLGTYPLVATNVEWSQSCAELETTGHTADGWKSFVPGMIEAASIKVSAFFNPTVALPNRSTQAFSITLPGSPAKTWSATTIVEDVSISADLGNVAKGEITLSATGKPTLPS